MVDQCFHRTLYSGGCYWNASTKNLSSNSGYSCFEGTTFGSWLMVGVDRGLRIHSKFDLNSCSKHCSNELKLGCYSDCFDSGCAKVGPLPLGLRLRNPDSEEFATPSWSEACFLQNWARQSFGKS